MTSRLTLRQLALAVLPTLAVEAYRAARRVLAARDYGYRGEYPDWKTAQADSTGYASEEILDRVTAALLKVRSGQAVYERDSVLFAERQYSWPVATALLWSASANDDKLDIIDFGGSLGSSYFQNRPFLARMKEVRWRIVEQPKFVERGRALFENGALQFHPSIAACGQNARLVLFSSSLQYLDNPYGVLAEAIRSGAGMIVIDRTVFIDGADDRITLQTVPSEIYPARLPVWLFSESKLREFLERDFKMFARFPSYLSTASLHREKRSRVEELGFIFVRRQSPLHLSMEKGK
jgi:putative methyltransferase (TIGR04325 family)